jgi:hypothetical protein
MPSAKPPRIYRFFATFADGISFANHPSKIAITPALRPAKEEQRMAERIANFDDWKDLFYKWQKDIGFDVSLVKDYKFDAIYDDGTGPDMNLANSKNERNSKRCSRYRPRTCATLCFI